MMRNQFERDQQREASLKRFNYPEGDEGNLSSMKRSSVRESIPREVTVTSELIRPSLSALSTSGAHNERHETDEVNQRTHIRFYSQGGEVRRTLTLSLSPGVHQISIGPLSPESQGLRVMMTRGEEDTLTLHARLEEMTLELRDEVDRSHFADPTLYVPMIPSETQSVGTQSSEPKSHSTKHESHPGPDALQSESQVYLQQLDSALKRSQMLMRSWLREPLQRSSLDLGEWSEGIEVLEAVIDEQLRELTTLGHVQRRADESAEVALSSPESTSKASHEISIGSPQYALITVEVERAARYVIEVSYQVSSVAWEPVYRARLSERDLERAGSKPRVEVDLNVEMAARFTQATGEDWLDVRGEFCLYPPPRVDFPTLSYPIQERVTLLSVISGSDSTSNVRSSQAPDLTLSSSFDQESSQRATQGAPALIIAGDHRSGALPRPEMLKAADASITKLFSDQARLKLSLELELSEARPRVEVIARGDLDALLPLAGGQVHRLISDEWLGVERHPPLALGEPLKLNFGSVAHITTHMMIKMGDTPLDEHLELRLHNHDHNVRTLLVCQALDHGSLLDLHTESEEESLPAGWVLSADQERLMRWISIPPKHVERLYLHRRLKTPRDS